MKAEYAQHRATLPGKVGLECTFYEGLYYRTMHLRESLYVTVTAAGMEFRPDIVEHFPRLELIRYQQANGFAALGKGETVDVVFNCYAPAGSGASMEAMWIISEGLEGLGKRLALGEWSRSMAAMRDQRRIIAGVSGQLPYRPPPGVVPERKPAPPKSQKKPSLDDLMVQHWRSSGRNDIADDYERMRGIKPQPIDPWKENYWTQR